MDTPCVSIIIPIYNAEKTIRRCVESILSQRFKNFELLLINDGSQDGSFEVCKEFAACDKRIRVLNKENGGVSSARNVGIENANGKWITFIDADDWISGNYFPLYLQTYNGDIVFCKAGGDEAEGEIIDRDKFLSEILGKPAGLGPWAKFFRRDIIVNGKIRFPICVTFGEDLIFNLRYFRLTRAICVNSQGEYHYEEPARGSMWYKYGITLESLETYSRNALEAYYRLGVRSTKLEASIFYIVITFYNIYDVTANINRKKKDFLRCPYMEELKCRVIGRFRLFRCIYISNKYLPYVIDSIVTKIYLRMRHIERLKSHA